MTGGTIRLGQGQALYERLVKSHPMTSTGRNKQKSTTIRLRGWPFFVEDSQC